MLCWLPLDHLANGGIGRALQVDLSPRWLGMFDTELRLTIEGLGHQCIGDGSFIDPP